MNTIEPTLIAESAAELTADSCVEHAALHELSALELAMVGGGEGIVIFH